MPFGLAQPSFFALLVHAVRDQRDAYAGPLKRAGFAVHQGSSGMQAIELTISLLPDVIILDLELEDFDGWQVCRLLKSGRETGDIPLIVLVPGDGGEHVERARESGCAVALTKPVTPEALVAATELVVACGAGASSESAAASAFCVH